MDPQKYGQLIFDKAGKNIQWKKKPVSSTNGVATLDSNMQKNETRTLSSPFTEINSKLIKYLNVRQETIKTLEEKAGKNLSDLSRSNFLFDTFPKARELKAKMN